MRNNQFYRPFPGVGNPMHQQAEAEKHKAADQLIQVIGDSHDVLARAKTVFPLTLVPDTLTVDRSKLTIARRDFFKVAEVMSIRIEDILNIVANVGPFFGSLTISTRFFDPDKPYVINNLRRADALKIKRIVQGYLIARREGVDCAALTTRELTHMLDELGKVAPEEKV